jgi:hypothetical protein
MHDPRPSVSYWLLLIGLALATACSDGSTGGGGGCIGQGCQSAAAAGARDRFGSSVSVSGDTIAVGASLDDDAGDSSGSVYVSRFDGMDWVEEQKLLASDAAQGDFFGAATSVSGDTLVVGGQWNDDAGPDSGSAYVYRFDGMSWVEEQKLVASDAGPGDFFGFSVSVSGDTIVVGAYLDDESGPDRGSAYVYRFDGMDWIEEQKLLASDGAGGDQFGYSVSVSDDAIVVGARNDGSNRGAAYVYRFDGMDWIEEQKLAASDAANGDLFGYAVSISGDAIVVGAPYDDDAGANSGSAYAYGFDGMSWVPEDKLVASDGADGDLFGTALSLSGDVVVVGAYLDDDAGPDSGSAYVFGFDGMNWLEDQKLVASDGDAGDFFGAAVAASSDTIVVGAQHDDDVAPDSGSAYAFGFDGMGWVEEQKLLASDAGN